MNCRPVENEPYPQTRGSVWLHLTKGLLLALIFSLVMLLLIALLLYLTALPEKVALYLVYAVAMIAILWGAAYAARRIGSGGWLNGGIVGVAYVLLLLAGGAFLVEEMTLGWASVSKIFLGFAFGAAGGMWGVNY
ncbi:MAG: TIGR04086 family membrane protein [Firmicutes bacterium]|nr:TIGR04086 family membrane protein [Bacillota bacterium]